MKEHDALVIVGAGLAGVSAAGSARESGFTGPILLLCEESDLPYDRPPLSKRVLLEAGAETIIGLRDEDWFRDSNIDLQLNKNVSAINRTDKLVHCKDGTLIPYGTLILATGSSVRRLPMLESKNVPVHYLRTRNDAVALRSQLREGAHVVVIGGGVIGLEVAGSARKLGCSVSVIEASERLMARSLSPSTSAFIKAYHESKGVSVRTATTVVDSSPQQSSGGHDLTLANGEVITADIVVAGIGVNPNIELAKSCGLTCEDGVVVNAYGQSDDQHIFVVGDAAKFESVLYEQSLHLETWQHAQKHGQVVGRNAVGAREKYDDVPWFWSDQHEMNIQLVGLAIGDAEIKRPCDDEESLMAFHLQSGRLMGATLINAGGNKRPVQKLIAAKAIAPIEKLTDPTVRLRSLAKEFTE